MIMKHITLSFLMASILFVANLHAQTISGTYAIKNVKTGIFIRIKDANTKNGTPIVAYSPVNWKCVTWDFKKQADNTYQLKNLFSGKTLQPVGKTIPGVSMEEQPLVAGSEMQQFEFISQGKDVYLIKLKNTSLYLTPSDKEGAENTPIILSEKTGEPLQQWTLQEQHPVM